MKKALKALDKATGKFDAAYQALVEAIEEVFATVGEVKETTKN